MTSAQHFGTQVREKKRLEPTYVTICHVSQAARGCDGGAGRWGSPKVGFKSLQHKETRPVEGKESGKREGHRGRLGEEPGGAVPLTATVTEPPRPKPQTVELPHLAWPPMA